MAGEPEDLAWRLLKWEGEEESNMMIALQEQAYALAEQEMPFDPEKHSDWEDWQQDIEPLGEYLLMHMMEDPEWGHVRDLYGQHSNAPPNYGDPPFKERDDIIDFYSNQGLPMPGESITFRGDDGRPVELKPVGSKPTMHEVEGQPEFPTGTLFNERTGFTTGEPMHVAFRLLKVDDDFMRDYFYQTARDSGIPEEEIDRAWEESRSWEQPIPESRTGEYHPGDKGEGVEGPRRHFPTQLRHRDASPGLGRSVQHDDLDEGTFRDTPFNEARDFRAGEPMEIAMRLLKHATSPEALRHKVEYDTGYESDPKRLKYREELNRERRKRGIMGQGGPDISHTREHTLVEEDPHANRARHFRERGTLKSVGVR